MPDSHGTTNGFPASAFDPFTLPGFNAGCVSNEDLEQFAKALNAPELSITALNDWRPIHQRVKRKKPRARRKSRRTKDETREGFVYNVLKWPLLFVVFGWILGLGFSYLLTRTYIWAYESVLIP